MANQKAKAAPVPTSTRLNGKAPKKNPKTGTEGSKGISWEQRKADRAKKRAHLRQAHVDKSENFTHQVHVELEDKEKRQREKRAREKRTREAKARLTKSQQIIEKVKAGKK